MFGLFKKKPSPKNLVNELAQHYYQAHKIVNSFVAPSLYIYEPGLFVAAVADMALERPSGVQPSEFAIEFVQSWISFLISGYEIEGGDANVEEIFNVLDDRVRKYQRTIGRIMTALSEKNPAQYTNQLGVLLIMICENYKHAKVPADAMKAIHESPLRQTLLELILSILSGTKKCVQG